MATPQAGEVSLGTGLHATVDRREVDPGRDEPVQW